MNYSYVACFAALFIGILTLASEPNIIQSSPICPPDSETVDGICKCNYEYCKKPMCDAILNLDSNFTDLPGHCCPTYTCIKCAKESLIGGICPCTQDTFLNDMGNCECKDRHKSLKGNICVCDFNKCELPYLCNETSVSVKVSDGCCSNVKCLPCPKDSYSKSYHSEDMEDMCLCFPCPEPECKATQIPVIIRKGKNTPGVCCDLYKCENKNTTEKRCKVGDTLYLDGGMWVTAEKDNCVCENGVSLCNKSLNVSVNSSCLVGDAVHPHLFTWVEDACTNCTCYNGEPKCVAHMCHVNISEINAPHCPILTTCKKTCPYGYKIRKGCEICKCRVSDSTINAKYPILETFMENFNLSENETVSFLQQHLNSRHGFSFEITTSPTPDLASPTSISKGALDTEKWFGTVLTLVVTFFVGFFCCCMIACAFLFVKNNYSYKYAPVKKPVENNNIGDSYCQKNFELQARSDINYITEKIPLT